MRKTHASLTLACLFAGALASTGCDRDAAGRGDARTPSGDDALPAPAGTRGGVTGMPDARSGEGTPVELGDAPAPTLPDIAVPPPATNPETGMAIDEGTVPVEQTPGAAEPTAQDAIAVLRGYYAAIDARDYARAYAAWADGGNASGQTPQQFAGGFAQTAGVSVEIQAPGAVEGAAGSRYVEVPVAIAATQRDGSVQRYVGAYVLRRSMVDGATPAQRAWHIQSADLRAVQP